MPPDLLAWSNGVASRLPLVTSGLQQRSEDIQKRKPGDRDSSNYGLLDSIASEDKDWSERLRPFSDGEPRRKVLNASDYGLGRLTLTLQNPSSSEMRRIRVNVVDIENLWGVFAEGTFLSAEEISAIQTGVIKSPNQVALPEIKSLPPGGMIKVSFYGAVWPLTKPRVTVENADVKMVEILTVEENWFLDLYQSYQPIAYVLLWVAALAVLPWAIQRVKFGTSTPEADCGTKQAAPPESDPGQSGDDPAHPPSPK